MYPVGITLELTTQVNQLHQQYQDYSNVLELYNRHNLRGDLQNWIFPWINHNLELSY